MQTSKDLKNVPFSDFAKFSMDLRGYDVYRKGHKIYKYEAFHICKDANKIISGQIKNLEIRERKTC